MDSQVHRVKTLYIHPKFNSLSNEVICEWFVNQYGQVFEFDYTKPLLITDYSTEHGRTGDKKLPLFEIVSVVPHSPPSAPNIHPIRYICDRYTQINCIKPAIRRFTLMIDGSISSLFANTIGKHYLNDAILAVNTFMNQLIFQHSIRTFDVSSVPIGHCTAVVSVLLFVPGMQCFTLLSNWMANADELEYKIQKIKSGLLKIMQNFATVPRSMVKSFRIISSAHILELLRHGSLSARVFSDGTCDSSLIIITDAVFSLDNADSLDKSLAHLQFERIRCSFLLLHTDLSDKCSSWTDVIEGCALDRAKDTGNCLPSIELCQFISHSTGGFVLSMSEFRPLFSKLSSECGWNELKQLLFTYPITYSMDEHNVFGSLNWLPVGTVQYSTKIVHASVRSVLQSKLKAGYRFSAVNSPHDVFNLVEEKEAHVIGDYTSPDGLRKQFLVEIDLILPWRIGITFHLTLRGLWLVNLKGVSRHENDVQDSWTDNSQTETPVEHPNHVCDPLISKADEQISIALRDSNYCEVVLKITSTSVRLHQLTDRSARAKRNQISSSLSHSFIKKNRQESISDKYLEYLNQFYAFQDTPILSESLRTNYEAVFFKRADTKGNPILVANQYLQSLSPFLKYWRSFVMKNPSDCLRWLDLYHVCGLFEHDSQLPADLHLPAKGSRFTATVTCRQALERLCALLANWSTLVLLEQHTYIRFLSDDSFSNATFDLPDPTSRSAPESQSNSSTDTNSTVNQTQKKFCLIRLEVNSLEFHLKVGFAIGISVCAKLGILRELNDLITGLKFPPRGRQAIPKSRHKSGAPLPSNSTHVPPLQRSWEDTPCCNLFHSRLDRLLLSTGLWAESSFLGLSSSGKKTSQHHSSSIIAPKPSVALVSSKPIQSSVCLSFSLLKQHLYHDSQIWIIQPIPLTTEGLRTMFSSLLNIRLQEGFHLTRVGPLPGFVSLATEVYLTSSTMSNIVQPCLIQYHLYPLIDARISDDTSQLSRSNAGRSHVDVILQQSIARMVEVRKERFHNSLDPPSIEKYLEELLNFDKTVRPDHPYRSVRIVTEVWIQPFEGRLVDPPVEAMHWKGMNFDQLPQQLFSVDADCIVNYLTLERICTVLSTNVKQVIGLSINPFISASPVTCTLGCLAPAVKLQWAESDLFRLLNICPLVNIYYPLLGPIKVAPSDRVVLEERLQAEYNDHVIQYLSSPLLSASSVFEFKLSQIECERFNEHLNCRFNLRRSRQRKMDNLSWRCFVASAGFSCTHSPLCCSSDSKTSIVVLFFPLTFVDSQHPALRSIHLQTKSTMLAEPDSPYLPIFIYTCSRPYLSFVTDDRWTYKMPPNITFQVGQSAVFPELTRTSSVPIQPPDDFISVAHQNLRLTQELNTLWQSVFCVAEYLSKVHQDALALTLFSCLLNQRIVRPSDLQTVLCAAKNDSFIEPLVINVTPFVLSSCKSFYQPIRKLRESSSSQSNHESDILANLFIDDRSLENNSVHVIPGPMENDNCLEIQNERLNQLFDSFVQRIPGREDIFVFRRKGSDQIFPLPSFASSPPDQCAQPKKPVCLNNCEPAHAPDFNESDTTESESAQLSLIPGNLGSKRGSKELPTDIVMRTVNQRSVGHDGSELPFFLQLRIVLTYGSQSKFLFIQDNLPTFCYHRFAKPLAELMNQAHDHLHTCDSVNPSLDLSLLKVDLEILPIFWVLKLSDRSRPNSCNQSTTELYCPIMNADVVSEQVLSCLQAYPLCTASDAQKRLFSRFVQRLAWELENSLICALRSLTPLTQPVVERVLRHIEDSRRLMSTPLFFNTKSNEDSTFVIENHLSKTKLPIELSQDYSNLTQTPDLLSLLHSIVFTRIPLRFITPSDQVFAHFLEEFERVHLTIPGLCLEYINCCAYVMRLKKISDYDKIVGALPSIPSSSNTQIKLNNFGHAHNNKPSPLNSADGDIRCHRKSSDNILSKTQARLSANCHTRSPLPAHHSLNVPHFTNRHGYEGDPGRQADEKDIEEYLFSHDAVQVTATSCPAREGLFPTSPDQSYTVPALYQPTSQTVRKPICSPPYTLPPYWLLFRVSSNSLCVFFHHPDTHQPHCVPTDYVSDSEEILPQPNPASVCEHCLVYQSCIKRIDTVVKSINQKILLGKLRDNRFCDEYLLPSVTTNTDSGPSVNQSALLKTNKFKRRWNTRKQKPTSRLLDHASDSSSFEKGDHNVADSLLPISYSPSPEFDHTFYPSSTGRNPNRGGRKLSVSSTTTTVNNVWRPGCFACPVQLTGRIPLQPRVFTAAMTSIQKVGLTVAKDRQVVTALRTLLEKPSIRNQLDMFFLIDQNCMRIPFNEKQNCLSTGPKILMESGEEECVAQIRENVCVFYMILKEITIEHVFDLSAEQTRAQINISEDTENYLTPSDMLSDAPHMSQHNHDSIAHSETSLTDYTVIQTKANREKVTQYFLQYSLHGLVKPSRCLARAVRDLLQTRLDRLVLDHFSESLSRNAINRVSNADLKFLSIRSQDYYLALPPGLFAASSGVKIQFSYAPQDLLLPFCHYLKQNLSSFLHPVKPTEDAFVGLCRVAGVQLFELFLHNRPRALGVDKPGVATLCFRLLNIPSCVEEKDQLHASSPITITGSAMPNESLFVNKPHTASQSYPSLIDLSDIVSNVTEFDRLTPPESETLLSSRHVLSVQICERGDADIPNLKARLKQVVQQTLYDLLTEYVVLTAPVKYTNPLKEETRENSPLHGSTGSLLHPFISTVVFPWIGQGRKMGNPLINLVTLNLKSSLGFYQFFTDLLSPYNNSWISAGSNSASGSTTNVSSRKPGIKLGDSASSNVTFHVYQRNEQLTSSYDLVSSNTLPSDFDTNRLPGQNRKFLVVGRNFPAWIQLVRHGRYAEQLPVGKKHVEQTQFWKPEFCFISYMQSLNVALVLPSSTPTNPSKSSVQEPTTTASQMPMISQTSVSTFPEFCAIDLEHLFKAKLAEQESSFSGRTSAHTLNSPPFVSVFVPRQTFCLLDVDDNQLTLYTYNWTKTESDSFVRRLNSLVEWYNYRYHLLNCLSLQKLGLFHTLNDDLTRWCANHAETLIHNTHPTDVTTNWDKKSANTSKSPGLAIYDTTVAKRFFPSFQICDASSLTPSADGNAGRFGFTSAKTNHSKPDKSVDQSDRVVEHFLHIFQDCSRVSPLESSSSPTDLPYQYGMQALQTMECDRRRACELDLLSLPFRAWQEGCKRRKAGDCDYTSTITAPIMESSIYGSGIGTYQAEAALARDPAPKQLKRFSAIRMACRHLHTICTPILFCPEVRRRAVLASRIESATLQIVAERCYRAQSEELSMDDLVTLLHTSSPTGVSIHRVQSLPHNVLASDEPPLSSSLSRSSTHIQNLSSHQWQNTISPWMNWAHEFPTETLDELTREYEKLNDPATTKPQEIKKQSSKKANAQTPEWVRKTSLDFLSHYCRYLQHSVGFRMVRVAQIGVTPSHQPESNSTRTSSTASYVLLHRAIHLAGVHIMEIFVRKSHLYVRLGTIELSRFSRHASRGSVCGPLSADKIAQAAASAAVTAASIRRDVTASVKRELLHDSTTLTTSKMGSGGNKNGTERRRRFENASRMSGFSWDESSRLCDYTHVHSFSYDYYLKAVRNYIFARHLNRSRNEAKPHTTYPIPIQHQHDLTDVIGIGDYPVTEFLADLYCLSHRAPIFSNTYLLTLPINCPVGDPLRPDQVFQQLIEDHRGYDINIIRMIDYLSSSYHNLSSSGGGGGRPFRKQSISCKFGITYFFQLGNGTEVELLPLELSHLLSGNMNNQSARYLVTAVVAADTSMQDGSDLNGKSLSMKCYLLATDLRSQFPKSTLTRLQDRAQPYLKFPVEWPAVAPSVCLDTTALPSHHQSSTIGLARTLSNEDNQILCSLLSGTRNRNRRISFNEADDPDGNQLPINVDSESRWHVSYLGYWPSHQVPICTALESARLMLETRITDLVQRSVSDCHENILWYRLFDSNGCSDVSEMYAWPGSHASIESTPICHVGPPTEFLSTKEIEWLVQSAPFKLDIFQLDDRLKETIRLGSHYFTYVAKMINHEFGINQSMQQQQQKAGQFTRSPMFAYHIRSDADSSTDWMAHYIALLSPGFTEGFILLSWKQLSREQACSPANPSSSPPSTEAIYKDFEFRAIFRTIGDPMNSNSIRRLIDSGQHMQAIFFERSSLAMLVTNFVEKLSYCLWRKLHQLPI